MPLGFANLSTFFSKESRWRFLSFRSLVRCVRFSAGVSSLWALRDEEDAAKTSSGASIVDVDFVVGNADSKVAVATFVTVDIVALGFKERKE